MALRASPREAPPRHEFRATGGALVWLLVWGFSLNAEVLYVRGGVAPGGDGKSWARAFADVHQALSAARSGDQIWVAAGTYYPAARDDRETSFRLREGVALYGGFRGTEASLAQRDPRRNRTVLSGDIGRKGYAEDNCYHVVRGANQAVLDGFVIRDGYGVPMRGGPGRPGRRPVHITPQQVLGGANPGSGAGMLNYQAAPLVRNCVFENNRSAKGGAVYNMTAGRPGGPGAGAPVPVFINCVFRKNYAAARGAGVSNDLGTSPVFLNCVFDSNETPQKGGGMYNDFGASPVLINCLFAGNQAESAAGMGNDGASAPVLLHCTFTRNRAFNAGPSLYQGTGPANNPAVLRSVIWGNLCDWEAVGIYNWHDNQPRLEESVVEGGYPGATATDPNLSEQGVSAADVGYKPGDPRFSESKLESLLSALAPYRAAARRGPPGRRLEQAPQEAPVPSSERVIYVSAVREADGDGLSWRTAHRSLQRALEDAGKDGAEVWVAAGAYRPSTTDRSASFVLRPGVKVYGGFTGRETERSQRDWRKNRTVLSGEIGSPGQREDNSYHVLTGATGAVVDGFTITGGYADGVGYDGKGGGLINYRRAPQERPNLPDTTGYSTAIRNCVFTRNYARDGGAVYSYDRGKPRFVNCVFRENHADNGGAVLDRVGVEAVYERCEFIANSARWRGGAAYFDYGSRPTVTGCVFRENSSQGHGGATYSVTRASQLEHTVVTVTRCQFEKNVARGDGGAAALDDSTISSISDSSFTANQAGRNGGAIAVTNFSTLDSKGNTFTGNSAQAAGNDVYQEEARGPLRERPTGVPRI